MEDKKRGILIGVANQKGGVGKTTTSTNLAAELTRRGYKVLGVDTDPQGNFTGHYEITTEGRPTILELLTGDKTFNEVVVKGKYCDVIPSDLVFGNYKLIFAQNPSFFSLFRNLFRKVATVYDYIIFDCAPAIDQISTAVMTAADYLIIPTEPGKFSLDGMLAMRETIKQVRGPGGPNPKLRVLGILLIKYSRREVLSQMGTMALENGASEFKTKLFDTKISNSSDAGKSHFAGVPLYEFNPKGKIAKEYTALVDEILSEIAKEAK